ncbi:hypothetical protein O181_075232 [Austropuccinia psidii MF-1]|uniref:Uncharacterized protein n=1 Tax=Austropuccinia psidii MF-1 TaxID=1389203 RepID=A0A9Q3FEK3_9BASI|nr:hypothetical protein [Austropuccinia psidii MF-1]
MKHDTMGLDMTDIVPEPAPKVSTSSNDPGIFLSHFEEFREILNYQSNITQESWKRVLDNINSIYKLLWDSLPKNDADMLLPVGIKVISNREIKLSSWLEEIEIAGLDLFKARETKELSSNNIWNFKFMKELVKPLNNIPKSEHSFFKIVQSLLYPSNPTKKFWLNVMFESIKLVSYYVIAPKPYVAPKTNSKDPLGLKWGEV